MYTLYIYYLIHFMMLRYVSEIQIPYRQKLKNRYISKQNFLDTRYGTVSIRHHAPIPIDSICPIPGCMWELLEYCTIPYFNCNHGKNVTPYTFESIPVCTARWTCVVCEPVATWDPDSYYV